MKKQLDSKLIQFGLNVKRLRLKAALTQEELAALVEYDVRTVQNIEAGGANVTLRKIYALCEALNITPGELL